MDIKLDKLREFFDKIKTLTFWQRLFGWASIKVLSYDSYSEYQQIITSLEATSKDLYTVNNTVSLLQKDNERLIADNARIASETTVIKQRNEELNSAIVKFKEENAGYKKIEDNQRAMFDEKVAMFNAAIERVQNERADEIKLVQEKAIRDIEEKKKTWSKHQEDVKNSIQSICQRRTVEYIDKPPFKGSPDNTIKICDEYVIFDAKSPATDDLSNFSNYIKTQAESVKKYINQELVRKDIYLVVPFNTIEVLNQFVYNMAEYNVYVVTLDVLEPIILSLKKIEEYEFVDQLSPEERDNICRIIGRFAHLTKRRIQIDHFFDRHFLEILSKCATDLPVDIVEKVNDFERQEKLNPPQEKRAKQILLKELITDGQSIRKEGEAKSIAFPENIDEEIK